MRPNVAFGASSAPNVAFGALDATNATLGRLSGQRSGTARDALSLDIASAGGDQKIALATRGRCGFLESAV